MCLGEVAQVVAVEDDSLVVQLHAEPRTVSTLALDESPHAGDWVLIHAGFALVLLSDEEATEALAIRAAAQKEAL